MRKLALIATVFFLAGLSQTHARSPIGFQEAKASKNRLLQGAASVESVETVRVMLKTAGKKIDWNNTVDVKIFTVLGGDPAMNGTLLNLALFQSPAEGFKVFELANVSSFSMSTKSGIDNVLKFNLNKDTLDANGNIAVEKWILLVDLSDAKNGKISTLERRDR